MRLTSWLALALCIGFGRQLGFGAEKHTNRLAGEKSPYLLQHAHNPVDWRPWGPEAFAEAKRLNKPVFLSVGYSTCHWCHVMERESFENEEVAKLINEVCVPVKVDREERPDVDRVYMTYVQASTGSGGWPMTVILTPEGKPFFGGTYFPPTDTEGMPGLTRILTRVKETWADAREREKLEASAGRIVGALKDLSTGSKPIDATRLDESRMGKCFEVLKKQYDATYGGFAPAPKFPQPSNLTFLFHYAARTGDKAPREIALHTLRAMAAGGVRDHLGGGFHRYSTDARWFLPHFEKMLYDQAQLVGLYLDAYQVSREESFAAVARDTLDFVLRELTGPDGEFYSALDADSAVEGAKQKREGAYYVWSADEIEKLLGKEDAAVFCAVYGVKGGGNVERDPRGEFTGRNVLFVARDPEAGERQVLARSRAKLLAAREKRPRPHLDDKTITAWNGLMVSAFARAGRVLGEEKYLEAARRAAGFLATKMVKSEAKEVSLLRRYREGDARIAGYADDYAYLIAGLIDLYEAGGDVAHLRLALGLQRRMDALFYDEKEGGYFATAADSEVLLRLKDDGDNAEPAASSVAALNLLRLAAMTDDKPMRERATKTLAGFAGKLDRYPAGLPMMLVALDLSLAKPRQVVLAGDPKSEGIAAMLREVNRGYWPNRVVMFADGGAGQEFLGGRLGFIKDVRPVQGKATAYVCENYACQLPTNDPAELRKQLAK